MVIFFGNNCRLVFVINQRKTFWQDDRLLIFINFRRKLRKKLLRLGSLLDAFRWLRFLNQLEILRRTASCIRSPLWRSSQTFFQMQSMEEKKPVLYELNFLRCGASNKESDSWMHKSRGPLVRWIHCSEYKQLFIKIIRKEIYKPNERYLRALLMVAKFGTVFLVSGSDEFNKQSYSSTGRVGQR